MILFETQQTLPVQNHNIETLKKGVKYFQVNNKESESNAIIIFL